MVHTLVSASCGWITDILLTVCLSLAYDICLHQETTPKRQAFQSHAIINSLSCQSSLSSSTFKHIHELPDVTPARVQMASWTTFFFCSSSRIKVHPAALKHKVQLFNRRSKTENFRICEISYQRHVSTQAIFYILHLVLTRVQTQINTYCVLEKILFTCWMFSLSVVVSVESQSS